MVRTNIKLGKPAQAAQKNFLSQNGTKLLEIVLKCWQWPLDGSKLSYTCHKMSGFIGRWTVSTPLLATLRPGISCYNEGFDETARFHCCIQSLRTVCDNP